MCFGLLVPLACSDPVAEETSPTTEPADTDPALEPGPGLDQARARAVRISASGCGYAPPTDGSGIVLGDGLVLTAAHVVAGATVVSVSPGSGDPGAADQAADAEQPDRAEVEIPATVVAYDTLRDLAVVRIAADDVASVSQLWSELEAPTWRQPLAEGQTGVVVGAATSGDVQAEVVDRTIIEIDEVRGSRRSQRAGYLLEAVTRPGDSGSGLYDQQGRLAGLLFAVSTADGARSWVTAADEIQAFLADRSLAGSFECDPDRSRLIRAE